MIIALLAAFVVLKSLAETLAIVDTSGEALGSIV